ncbi:MAG: permease prefix domain 1-containing protein [Phycisphaerales bacterium]
MLRGAVELVRRRGPSAPARTPAEIDADIADEIASHLAMRERSFVDAGLDGESARRLARHRFGDIDRITTRCRRIAMEEQVMVQRLNAVLTVLLLVAVALLGIQFMRSQQATRDSLATIDARLVAMQGAGVIEPTPGSPTGKRTANMPPAANTGLSGFVYLAGDVERAGVYDLPPLGSLTIRRLLAAAGVHHGPENQYIVTIRSADQPGQVRESIAIGGPADASGAVDAQVMPGDLVDVRRVGGGEQVRKAERESKAEMQRVADLKRQIEQVDKARVVLAQSTSELMDTMTRDELQACLSRIAEARTWPISDPNVRSQLTARFNDGLRRQRARQD